jgi:hypothetical protein
MVLIVCFSAPINPFTFKAIPNPSTWLALMIESCPSFDASFMDALIILTDARPSTIFD